MSICNPKQLRQFLEQHSLAAKACSSQNFLIDGNIVRKILNEAELSSKDLIIEIGPGPGALTEALLANGCTVIAIEKDVELANLLQRFSTEDHRLEVITGDFLTFPLGEFLQKKLTPGQKAKVIANLPYHITTPILEKLAPLSSYISDLVVMVQQEVAVRFAAQAGTKDYSSFTLFLQFFSQIKYCFTIEPTCFYPKPSVRSAVVHLRLQPPRFIPFEDFFTVTRGAFGKRRKMIRSTLKERFPVLLIESCLKNLGLSPTARPEELSLSDWIAFYEMIRS